MRKFLLLCLYILTMIEAKASDTLTVRQVFNFTVGDTFDYKIYRENVDGTPYSRTMYKRRILTQQAVSNTLDTIFIQYYLPIANTYEHDTITDLDSLAILQSAPRDTFCQFRYRQDTTSYPGYLSNTVDISCFESVGSYKVTGDLGITVIDKRWIGQSGIGTNMETETLIYYANGTKNLGTPYTILGISTDMAPGAALSIFPVPASNTLNILIPGTTGYADKLVITDLLGQDVYSSLITGSETAYDISGLPSGIYSWQLKKDNTIIKTGKLVKQ